MVITIDGPSGSGKSTVARKLARTLAFLYVNQGAFFRAIGLVAKERGLDLDSDEQMLKLANSLCFEFCFDEENKVGLLVDGANRSEELLSANAGHLASLVAIHPGLRDYLLSLQKVEVREASLGAVVEGRDAGSVGFPQAELKLYLDANPKVRAKRRFEELKELHASNLPTVEQLAEEMHLRDERDRKREVAPLSIPNDAVVIDTSEIDVDGVLEEIVELVENLGK